MSLPLIRESQLALRHAATAWLEQDPDNATRAELSELLGRLGDVNAVGEEIADAGDRGLIEQPCLERCSAGTDSETKILPRDLSGIRPERVDVRLEANPAEAAFVEEPELTSVFERHGEARPFRLVGVAFTDVRVPAAVP